MKIIEANNLIKNYINNKVTTNVLRGISLSINKGEFLSIIGPSGSGKTTLLYVLSGLEKYTSGSIKLFDKEISTYTDKELSILRQKRIGFVFQFYNLISHLSVYENILLAQVLSKKKSKYDINQVLNIVGLSDYKNYYPNQISGGMQQRVAIARCLINDPEVIFADEPTGNLDYKNSIAIMELFKDLNRKYEKTIILVTHNEEMVYYGTRYIRLRDGLIISDEKIKSKY